MGLSDKHDLTSRMRQRSDDKTRKSIETRRRIMATASSLIIERGNTAFKMSEISEMCGMSKGALYYYFADRQDLVSAIYDQETEALLEAIKDVVENANSAGESLLGICNEFARRVAEGSPLAMALVRELLMAREEDEVAASNMHKIMHILADQIEAAKAEGLVRKGINSWLSSVAACGAFTFAAICQSDKGEGDAIPADFTTNMFNTMVLGIGEPGIEDRAKEERGAK